MSGFRHLINNLNLEREKKAAKKVPKKIYYIWNYLEWGGAQVYFFGLMKAMKEYCEVSAFMPRGSNSQLQKFLENLNVPYSFFDCYKDSKPASTLKRKLQRHWNKLYCEFIMLRFLNKFDFKDSIIHIELPPWESLITLIILCFNAPVFVTIHNSILPIPRHRYIVWQIKFRILARIKNFHIFAANKDAKESLRTLLPKRFFKKIKVTYANVNPVEIRKALDSKNKREEICNKYGLPQNKFLVFCVGQFIDRKGRWIFLESAKEICKISNDFSFVWISNSKPTAEDIERINSFGFNENFIFITSDQIGKEHLDLFKLMTVSDLFTLPSFVEGLPISLLEAMSLGIPCISTNVFAIPEAIKHLETGYLIEAGNPEALKNGILLLKSDKNLRDKLAINGQNWVLENFNEQSVAQIAIKEYFNAFSSK